MSDVKKASVTVSNAWVRQNVGGSVGCCAKEASCLACSAARRRVAALVASRRVSCMMRLACG